MTERWLPAVGWEGRYEVSDAGRVRSLIPVRNLPIPHILAQHLKQGVYPTVKLRPGNSAPAKRVQVHQLVAAAFIGPRPPKFHTRHLNGDPTDNRVENLAYGTSAENQRDAVLHGTNRRAAMTHCEAGHEYTPENTRWYLGRRRICLTCQRRHQLARRDRERDARRKAAVA